MFIYTLMILSTLFTQNPSIYDYSFTSIDGQEVNFSDFKGKTILIVNTASKCGFTKQYKDLQALHEQNEDLVIIGFPANNFGSQEPGANEEIQEFCEKNYGVTFLLAEKVDVKGKEISPIFDYLTKAENPDFTGDIKWNFEKFLINKEGKLVHRYRSAVNPLDKSIVDNI
ncbi:glutathione peroxidase [Sphingobacterium hungaricum]|uniref:Glutathione peroxidase n=1 Tax=Sphingobacterium hungaricum TaxID=2082723 RepID=A0A928UYM6_9SPHI|nr:glutathione peroxidase [Sphingobacterium hungaricum]MBE8715433.1 glutathione peroxidase [Sphingobacterium hungaricum]